MDIIVNKHTLYSLKEMTSWTLLLPSRFVQDTKLYRL